MSLVIDRIIDEIELIELCFHISTVDPARLQLMKLWQFNTWGCRTWYEPNEIPRIRLSQPLGSQKVTCE